MKKKVFRENAEKLANLLQEAIDVIKEEQKKEMKIAGVEVKIQEPKKTTKKKVGK